MKLPGVAWRAMSGYDVDAVAEIAGVVHPDFFEAPEVLAERQRLYHYGSYLLEVNERPAGYVAGRHIAGIPPENRLSRLRRIYR